MLPTKDMLIKVIMNEKSESMDYLWNHTWIAPNNSHRVWMPDKPPWNAWGRSMNRTKAIHVSRLVEPVVASSPDVV